MSFRRYSHFGLLLIILMVMAAPNQAAAEYLPVARNPSNLRKAVVFNTSAKKIDSRHAYFKGRVKGRGLTALMVRFFRNGRIIEQRLLGRVRLSGEPRGVFFSSKTPFPRVDSLKWKIVAFSSNH